MGPTSRLLASHPYVIIEIGHRFDLYDFHIVGSAAMLGALPTPPEGALTAMRDLDVIPPQDDERMAEKREPLRFAQRVRTAQLPPG